jgi:hypothetical protein
MQLVDFVDHKPEGNGPDDLMGLDRRDITAEGAPDIGGDTATVIGVAGDVSKVTRPCIMGDIGGDGRRLTAAVGQGDVNRLQAAELGQEAGTMWLPTAGVVEPPPAPRRGSML